MWCDSNRIWPVFILSLGVIPFTQSAWLRCYYGTLDEFLVTPLEQALPLISPRCINSSLPTIFYTFGYRGRVRGPATTAVLTAYLATKKRNVILVDWEEDAKSGLLGISLGYAFSAVPSAKRIGKQLGNTLVQLAEAGLNMTEVHLVGHSLGAHLMAYAGRESRSKGFVVSRITGLDPARALFEGNLAALTGLDRTCARFVDVIHTDPGGYGTSKTTGTVDFWPNFAGKDVKQPGCPDGNFEMFSSEDLCSHDRSWRYFVEAIASPIAFQAADAESYGSWLAQNGSTTLTIFMGDLTNTRAQGNYFLSTNPKSPFGKREDGLRPHNILVRSRRRISALSRLLRYLR